MLISLGLLTLAAFSSTTSQSGGEAKLEAWKQHRAMTAALPEDAPAWRALGPKNCGGRIEAVDSPAGRPSVIYGGVGSGGVWKSVNGGLSWDHVFAHEATCAIGGDSPDPGRGRRHRATPPNRQMRDPLTLLPVDVLAQPGASKQALALHQAIRDPQ